MQLQQEAYLARPEFVPPPPGEVATQETNFEVGFDRLRHIDDPLGRRLFEGWASLAGIDWQDEEILPSAFENSARDYLRKNPVLLWDHHRHIPIGKCLELTLSPQGVYMKGEIFRAETSPTCPIPTDANGKVIEGFEPFLAKANEVWWGVQNGNIRGLSVNGKARKRAVWSPELGRYVKQAFEVLLYEISVTPAQVHPGSKIVAVNTLAKALTITKALPLPPPQQRNKMNKILQLQKQLIEELRAQASANGGVDLPEEFVSNHDAITKALQFSPGEESVELGDAITKAVAAAVAPLQQKIASLEGTPAPLTRQVTMQADPQTQAKPGTDTGNEGQAITKALDILSKSVDGRADFGKGDVHRVDALGAMKLVLARAAAKKTLFCGPLDLTNNEQNLLKACL